MAEYPPIVVKAAKHVLDKKAKSKKKKKKKRTKKGKLAPQHKLRGHPPGGEPFKEKQQQKQAARKQADEFRETVRRDRDIRSQPYLGGQQGVPTWEKGGVAHGSLYSAFQAPGRPQLDWNINQRQNANPQIEDRKPPGAPGALGAPRRAKRPFLRAPPTVSESDDSSTGGWRAGEPGAGEKEVSRAMGKREVARHGYGVRELSPHVRAAPAPRGFGEDLSHIQPGVLGRETPRPESSHQQVPNSEEIRARAAKGWGKLSHETRKAIAFSGVGSETEAEISHRLRPVPVPERVKISTDTRPSVPPPWAAGSQLETVDVAARRALARPRGYGVEGPSRGGLYGDFFAGSSASSTMGHGSRLAAHFPSVPAPGAGPRFDTAAMDE